jgi:hypothetical protein
MSHVLSDFISESCPAHVLSVGILKAPSIENRSLPTPLHLGANEVRHGCRGLQTLILQRLQAVVQDARLYAAPVPKQFRVAKEHRSQVQVSDHSLKAKCAGFVSSIRAISPKPLVATSQLCTLGPAAWYP